MKTYMRCKACGYIIDEKGLKGVCPACGVPSTSFEPYTSKISEKRRMLLGFHIHPIIVHFPQSFALFFPVCLVLALVLPVQFREYFSFTARIIALFMPLSVIGGLITGIFDGTLRFKKITRPALVKKIVFGSLFFISSTIVAILSVGSGFDDMRILSIILVLSVFTIGCAGILGKIGAPLMDAILPGK